MIPGMHEQPPAAQPQWEYRQISLAPPDDSSLNSLGQMGWELVGVAAIGSKTTFYFKRPAPDFRERVTIDQKCRYYRLWGLPVPDEKATEA